MDNAAALKNPDYADKADLRRRFVGSEHPSHKKRQEAPASVHRWVVGVCACDCHETLVLLSPFNLEVYMACNI